jgi:hypothetical protein
VLRGFDLNCSGWFRHWRSFLRPQFCVLLNASATARQWTLAKKGAQSPPVRL